MDFMQDFERIMTNTAEMALATVNGDKPDVRVVDFYFCNDCKHVFISTFKGTGKIDHIAKNNNVSFTTIPVNTAEFVRVRNATAKESEKTVADLKDCFVGKYPMFEQMYAMGLDKFVIYEIEFKDAYVNRTFGEYGDVTL